MNEAEYCKMQSRKSEPCAKCAVLKSLLRGLTSEVQAAIITGKIKHKSISSSFRKAFMAVYESKIFAE